MHINMKSFKRTNANVPIVRAVLPVGGDQQNAGAWSMGRKANTFSKSDAIYFLLLFPLVGSLSDSYYFVFSLVCGADKCSICKQIDNYTSPRKSDFSLDGRQGMCEQNGI